ncbi:MAG: hypothetical protein ACE5G9_13060 [Nitrospinales bacterium]
MTDFTGTKLRRRKLAALGAAGFFCLPLLLLWASPSLADAGARIGPGELARLLADHPPLAVGDSKTPAERFERKIILTPGGEPTVFAIPGFNRHGCNECHNPETLVQQAADRMSGIVRRLAKTAAPPPLRQYIIQPQADALLQARQFAHATFDTIRLFPRTILIDTRVYGNATQLHETLHLGQRFVGQANELEAYGLNIRADPRFLLLHYPYFSNVAEEFFLPDLPQILERYFSRPARDNAPTPRETQFFMMPFDEEALARVAGAVKAMEPLLREVSRLNRDFPLRAAYLSDQTGIGSLLLDIAAAGLLPLSKLDLPESLRQQATALLAEQMERTDNTRLGYRIDRRKEALLIVRHQLGAVTPRQAAALYFHYLQRRFVTPQGTIDLRVPDATDFRAYVNGKLEDIRKLLQYPGITTIEQRAGERSIEAIKKKLPAP